MDNWKHRSDRMRCSTCMFYVPKTQATEPAAVKDAQTRPMYVGRCRRHAPTLGGYPVVFEADWCGDHELDEGKL